VRLPELIVQKINYLLTRFKDIEWSGPAWYSVRKQEDNGFPIDVELAYFKPIHLGNGAETELDGNKMGKLLPRIYKKSPDLKDCFLGLIHSHHTMGAFLSSTDESTALEQAVFDGLFFSTVVASSKSPFATCVTYRDQFGYSNIIEGEVETDVQLHVPKEWKQEATRIEKAKKKEDKKAYKYTPMRTATNEQLTMGYTRPEYYHNGWGYQRTIEDEPETKKKVTVGTNRFSKLTKSS